MFKKIVSALIVVSILGYFILHDAIHVRVNSSIDSAHSASIAGHQYNNLLEIVDHHEDHSAQEHGHLDNLFSRILKQKDFKNKSALLLAFNSRSFEVPVRNIFISPVRNTYGINYSPPFNFRNSPLRI